MSSRRDAQKLLKSRNLPSLEDLERIFEFKLDDDSIRPLSDVSRSIAEKLGDVHNALEDFIFISEGSPGYAVYEAQRMSGSRNDYFDAYKKSAEIYWIYMKCKTSHDEKHKTEFIRMAYDAWMNILMPKFQEFCDAKIDAWRNYNYMRDDSQYHR